MDAILLRKLSRKSILQEGKYSGLSIQEMINLGHTRILRWYYYNLSNIDFLEDIKNEIGITPDVYINKPGVDKRLSDVVNEIMLSKMPMKGKMHQQKLNKVVAEKTYRKSSRVLTKAQMQAKNHGR